MLMPRWLVLSFALLLLPTGALRAAEANRLTAEELADGWILLFDGETLFGWEPTSKADWKAADGAISVGVGEQGLLRTTSEFADFLLKVDFRNPKGTNSGVFLRSAAQPKDPAVDCYELNIADESVSPFPTGSFVNRAKRTSGEESAEWRTFEVRAEAGHFTVRLDGQSVLDYTDPKPLARGFIGLQFNSGPVAFRNLKLKPLGLKPIFNGRDLSGWRLYPGKQTKAAVTTEGWLHITEGPGQLETEHSFGDFVLQLEAFVAGKGMNSGIFFRNIPGELMQGYESQIQNGFRDGDRTKPQDCGTGGIYRRQDARRVVSDDFVWFQKTLVVSGKHVAVWVNGYPVSDWADPRPADENPRKGSRVAAGTFALQSHDSNSDFSFRNLRAVEMPAR